MKKDDSSLTPDQQSEIRRNARRLLQHADALGVLPTPVAQVVSSAKLTVDHEISLDPLFLGGLYRELRAPLKRAVDKILGIVDLGARHIYLDLTVHEKKKPFLILHETAHSYLPWQRELFALVEDSEMTIDPETKDLFEREANCFASEILFQLDQFDAEAADCVFSIKTPLKLAKRYGSSFYSAARRYISNHKSAAALIIFDKPIYEPGVGYTLKLRRSVHSRPFNKRFGRVDWIETCGPDDFFTRNAPIHCKFIAPRPCTLTLATGARVDCVIEAFNSTHEIFFLLCPSTELNRKFRTP